MEKTLVFLIILITNITFSGCTKPHTQAMKEKGFKVLNGDEIRKLIVNKRLVVNYLNKNGIKKLYHKDNGSFISDLDKGTWRINNDMYCNKFIPAKRKIHEMCMVVYINENKYIFETTDGYKHYSLQIKN